MQVRNLELGFKKTRSSRRWFRMPITHITQMERSSRYTLLKPSEDFRMDTLWDTEIVLKKKMRHVYKTPKKFKQTKTRKRVFFLFIFSREALEKKSCTEISGKKLRFSRAVKTSTAKTWLWFFFQQENSPWCWEEKMGRCLPWTLRFNDGSYDSMTLFVEKANLGGTHVQLPWWEDDFLQLVMSPRWVEPTFCQASRSVAKLAAWVGILP